MLVPRRSVLALLAAAPAVSLAGCVPSPVVDGTPAAPFSPTPTKPAQSDAAKAAAGWSAGLRALAAGPAAPAPWGEAVAGACDAHLSRLLAADPLVDGAEAVFEAPAPAATPPPDAAGFEQAVAAHLQQGVELFTGLVTAEGAQPMRLLWASLAAFARGAGPAAPPPTDSGARPIRFPVTGLDASLGVALTHAWALIQGIELGLARLPRSDARKRLGARLPRARALRNRLRDAISGTPPVQGIDFEMPTPMTTPEEVRQGIGLLESRLLDGLARVVAAGPKGDGWLADMLAQVDEAGAWGAGVDYWPGWVEVG